MLDSLLGEFQVGAVEVVEIPEDYLKTIDTESRETNYRQSFKSILRGMIHADIPVCLRLERINGKTRTFFLTWTRKEENLSKNLTNLASTLSAYLPKFVLHQYRTFSGLTVSLEQQGVTACLLGEPESTGETEILSSKINPMDAAGEVLQVLDNVLLQVFVEPTKSGKRQVKALERAYESAMQRSQRVISSSSMFSPDSQQSTTKVNSSAARKAERYSRQVTRMSSRYLGKVTVTVTHWHQDKKKAEAQVRQVMSVLLSGITPADREEDLRVVIKKRRKDFDKVLAGRPVGNHTVLTPEETAIYFTLPKVDLGIKVSRREDFSVASVDLPEEEKVNPQPEENHSTVTIKRMLTQKKKPIQRVRSDWRYPDERLILFGYAIRNNEPQKTQPYGIVRKMFGSHILVCGNTGYGKTTTCVSIAAQAYRNGVTPIILTPGNVDDWRVLKDLYPEFRIFTAGNPDIAPLRHNMWDVPPKVPVGKYIDRMVDVHTAALPTDGVISMHFDDIFNTMYENCGWSRMGNVRGRPILLSDLYEAVQQVANTHLEYGENLKRDFYGALDARLRSMLRNEILVDMFNTQKGLTIPELLTHPTIIEMRDLSPEDRSLLIGALTVGINEYLVANPKKQVSHLLVLEEAHQFLKGSQILGYAEPTSTQKAISNISGMMRTQRGTGLGFLIIDQLVSSLPPEIVKLPANIIIHTLTDLEERLLAGRQALCTDSQINHIGGMGVGEVVVRVQTKSVPANVQIAPLDFLLTSPLPKREWTDEMVRDAMQKVFETNPELAESQPLTSEMKDMLRGIRPSSPPPLVIQPEMQPIQVARGHESDISVIVNTPVFVDAYMSRIESARENPGSIARLLTKVASKFCTTEAELVPFTERLLLHAAGMLQEPKETAVLAEILVAIRGITA